MRFPALLLVLSAACSSSPQVVSPGGTPPVDVQVGGIQIQTTPLDSRPDGVIAGADVRGAGTRPEHRSQMLVSIMNVSEHDVTLDRLDFASTGGRARIQALNHPMRRRIDSGETIEVNVPVTLQIGGGSLGDLTAGARIRLRVVLLNGEVWPFEFEVPVYQGR